MINKRFEEIEKADIEQLVDNTVSESRTLEYKQELPKGGDDDKREFLADISSFANASGGDIIYGVAEKRDGDGKSTGEPDKALGLQIANTDAEIRRLENIIRDGIEPRIPVVRVRSIEGFPQGPVLIIRVQQSWVLPHMVTFKHHSKFYSRNSAGKYPLDITELRSAFLRSNEWGDRIKQFRDARMSRLMSGEGSCPLPTGVLVVMHLVPVVPVDAQTEQQISRLTEDHRKLLRPIGAGIAEARYNIDGFVSYTRRLEDESREAYVQLFRNGAIESVSVDTAEVSDRTIASVRAEISLILALSKYLDLQHNIGVPTPIALMLSLTGMKGFTIEPRRERQLDYEDTPRYQIDRDILMLPDVLIEDYEQPADIVLRPVFDDLWQAAGWNGCKNYESNGRHMSIQEGK